MTNSSEPIIDLKPKLDAIRRRYSERYHLSTEALVDAAALWGITPELHGVNSAGVFVLPQVDLQFAQSYYTAQLRLVQTPNGFWALSTRHSTPISGRSYAASVWNRFAYRNERDAHRAALQELTHAFKSHLQHDRPNSGRELTALLADLGAARTPQLALF